MPTAYLSRQDEWKQKLNEALKESEKYSFYAGKKPNRNRKLTKDSEFYLGNDFASGFLQRQGETKRESFVQHQTRSPKSYSGRNPILEEQGRLDNSTKHEPFSGKGFFDGFSQRSKCGSDSYSALNLSSYEPESLYNSVEQKRLSTRAQYPKKPSIAPAKTPCPCTQYISTNTSSSHAHYTKKPSSTQAKKDGFMQHETKPSKYYTDSDERDWLPISSRSTAHNPIHQQYKKKPPISSIQTPSPSTQYFSTSTTTSRSTSYFYAARKISEAQWQELEKNKSQDEQKEFLAKYKKEGRFVDVSVSWSQRNVSRGDHIFYQGGSGRLYDHHLLCTEVYGNDIYIIEYTGPSFGLSASSRSVISSNPLAFGAIERGKLTYKELEKKKAKIRHWPKELERFSVDEVIARALERKNEQDYHAFDNNCESFVNWCKCGLSTSLQVKPWFKPAWDGVKAVGSAALHGLKRYGLSEGVPAFLKGVGNVSDEIFGAISSPLSPVGFAVGGVIETGFAAWNIYQDYKRMKQDRLSESQFKINSVATASKAVGHIAGGITGSVIGSVAGPVGSVLGGAVGYGVGHLVGSAVGLCYEHAPKIKKAFQDYVITPVKKVVNSCVNAVKTAVQTVWKGFESVFSLFSWW